MSIADVLGRVQQIQSTITQLSPGLSGGTARSSTGSSSATTFAGALAQAESATGAAAGGAPGAAAAAGAAGATLATGSAGAKATAPTGAALPGASGITGDAIVETAKKYLGVPYELGGEDANGIDCSGLVQRVMKDLGVDVPRLVSGQSTLGTEVTSLKDARPGDLIVNDNGGHISIYLGDNKILYAPKPGDRVKINSVYFPESEIVTIRRVAPEKTIAAATAALAAPAGIGAAGSALAPGTTDLATAALRSSLMSGGSL
ncbi:C40 family peptidase [Planctomonas deserti]|uniref:C40 family peptidase n=1 Tax=Planctomonas deserti TaxID=2144185 RepID=UPI000D353FEE|nr:C40 family peptidase [Planctomonas deserti]